MDETSLRSLIKESIKNEESEWSDFQNKTVKLAIQNATLGSNTPTFTPVFHSTKKYRILLTSKNFRKLLATLFFITAISLFILGIFANPH